MQKYKKMLIIGYYLFNCSFFPSRTLIKLFEKKLFVKMQLELKNLYFCKLLLQHDDPLAQLV